MEERSLISQKRHKNIFSVLAYTINLVSIIKVLFSLLFFFFFTFSERVNLVKIGFILIR